VVRGVGWHDEGRGTRGVGRRKMGRTEKKIKVKVKGKE